MLEQAAGYIFLCANATEDECFDRQLFGGMEPYLKQVGGLKKGDTLFTFNFQTKRLHGVFEATSEVKKNIVPEAWGGMYPWQVQVKLIEDHPSISQADFGKYLSLVRGKWPPARLQKDTVEALLKLFRSRKRVQIQDNSTPFTSKDGHRVRSLGEKTIDDWLWARGVRHAYEYPIPGGKYCDFFLPDDQGGTYIEYWGLNDEKYLKDKAFKKRIYKKHGLKLVSIESGDIKRIDQILSQYLIS